MNLESYYNIILEWFWIILHNSIFDYYIDKLQILRCRELNNQYITCNYKAIFWRDNAMIIQTLNKEINKKM